MKKNIFQLTDNMSEHPIRSIEMGSLAGISVRILRTKPATEGSVSIASGWKNKIWASIIPIDSLDL